MTPVDKPESSGCILLVGFFALVVMGILWFISIGPGYVLLFAPHERSAVVAPQPARQPSRTVAAEAGRLCGVIMAQEETANGARRKSATALNGAAVSEAMHQKVPGADRQAFISAFERAYDEEWDRLHK